MNRYLFLMAATACMLSCAGNGDSGNGVELLDAAACLLYTSDAADEL